MQAFGTPETGGVQPAPAAQPAPLLGPSGFVLVLANLVPLFGVVWLKWEVFPLLLLFWFENAIVGAFNVLKMLLAAPEQRLAWAAKLFMVPFFCVHYAMFTFVHSVFVIGLFGGGFRQGAPFPDAHAIVQMAVERHLGWAVLGLAVSHGFSFAYNYLWLGEFRNAALPMLMQQPYSRVVVMHLTILASGFLMGMLGSPAVGLVLLVVLKTAMDLRAHVREREKLAPPVRPGNLSEASAP